MKERLYRTLNIKYSESSQVLDLLLVQFFLGLANAFLNIVAFTLFIYNFPVHQLPYVYLAVAAVLLVINFFYEKIEHRFTPLQLLKVIIGFSTLVLLVLWLGLSFWNRHNFIFILLMANTIIYMIISYAYWGLVSLLFNVRESRRVFSIVGSGDIPAKLIGYMAAPLLIPFLGLNNLIWLSIISLVTGFFIFNKVIRKKSWDLIRSRANNHDNHEVVISKKKDFVSFFFKDKLIFTISLLSILSYNVFILIDYTFISQVKIRFEKITDLAVYIATFFVLGRFVALIFKLIFTSRVIERLGIIYSLFITPVALFIFCVLFLWYGDHANYNVFIFGAMALFTEVLRSTMQEPVFFILFQPLKEQLRLKGHIISKGYMLAPSLIIVGLSLLFIYTTSTPLTILFTVKVILVNLCIWAVIIIFIQKTYLKTLHSSIKKGTFSSDDIYINDREATDILLKKVNTGKRIEIIYSLNLLEKAGYKDMEHLLLQLLENPDKDVKKYALDQLSEKEKVDVDTFKNLLAKEEDKEVQEKIIAILCKYDAGFLQVASENISQQSNEVQKIIIINLLNQQEFNYLFKAGKEIDSLIHSSHADHRALAVSIISEVKHVQFTGAIAKLINDEEISVRRSAITAACKLKIKSLLPVIFEISGQPENKYLVLKALQIYGDNLYRDIQIISLQSRMNYNADLVKIAGKIKGPYSTAFLLSAIGELHSQENNIVHSMWNKEYEPNTEEEVGKLKLLLNNYLRTGVNKINDYNGIPATKERIMLKNSLRNEIKSDLISALKLCVLLYRKKDINRVLELIEMQGNTKVFNAMEMLELMLPQKASKKLNYLFDFVLDPPNRKTATGNYEMNTLFQKVFFSDAVSFNPWTKAVCMYSFWMNNETALLKKLHRTNGIWEPYIIKETREYVLTHIK